jgi:hypothetical protein
MATVLQECTVIEQRSVVCSLWAKGFPAKDIYEDMLPEDDEKCLSRKAVYNWF